MVGKLYTNRQRAAGRYQKARNVGTYDHQDYILTRLAAYYSLTTSQSIVEMLNGTQILNYKVKRTHTEINLVPRTCHTNTQI